MFGPEFVQGVAEAIRDTHHLILADENPVQIVWAFGANPETVMVTDSDGDVFQLQISRVTVDA